MWNIRQLLQDNFGSPDGVVGLASKHNVDVPQREAIRKWFERGKVPGEAVLALQLIAKRETGRPIDIERYLVTGVRNDIFA